MYGYIYKITVNNPDSSWNGHYYIGQKKGAIVDKYYWGGGKKIGSYLKKYGPYGLVREILCWAATQEELNELERREIGDLWRTDPLCMNCMAGGQLYPRGGVRHTEATRKKISETMKAKCRDSNERARLAKISRERGPYTEETKRKISESNKKAYQDPEVRKKVSIANKGRNPLVGLTEEQIKERYRKASQTHKTHLEDGTIKPPLEGFRWYNNGTVQVVAKECPEGFVPGKLPTERPGPLAGKHWYNNGVVQVAAFQCPEGFVPGILGKRRYYNNGVTTVRVVDCPEGFVPGPLKSMHANRIGMHWYNNGAVQLLAKECPEGFVKGRLPFSHKKEDI